MQTTLFGLLYFKVMIISFSQNENYLVMLMVCFQYPNPIKALQTLATVNERIVHL